MTKSCHQHQILHTDIIKTDEVPDLKCTREGHDGVYRIENKVPREQKCVKKRQFEKHRPS